MSLIHQSCAWAAAQKKVPSQMLHRTLLTDRVARVDEPESGPKINKKTGGKVRRGGGTMVLLLSAVEAKTGSPGSPG